MRPSDTAMIVDYSPFTPGLPVPLELFVGRDKELKRLAEHIGAAARGRLRVAFLTGERGIGKTSLAAYVKSYAERDHNMVGVHVMLGGANTIDELVRRVFEGMVHEGKDKKWFDNVKDFFANTVKSADLLGLKLTFSPDAAQLTALTRNFAEAIKATVDRLAKSKKAVGFTLVLDNINGLAESREFADWLKSFLDDIAVNRQMPLCVLLVGIDERRQALIDLNPSLARSFDLFPIEPWNAAESEKFFTEAFESVGVTVTKGAMSLMVACAGGLPAVAHEIGDASLREDSDKKIDIDDAGRGIGVAAKIVGQKHIRQQVVAAIKSKKYKSILQKLLVSHGGTVISGDALGFDRGSLKGLLSSDESGSLDNFLQRMKELGVILPEDDEGPGCYKFSSYIMFIYLFLTIKQPAPAA